ncbi:hypothetical protein SAMN02745866_03014 [Alteromonadaceae bacterium Bs31]|nr:hypothetical protein SAMN02745866_03014 [Alteromonadaceae bacterium Bs31]
MFRLTALLPLIVLSACSSVEENLYNAAQLNSLNNCEQHVDSHAKDCREEHKQSFDDYTKQREDLLKNGKASSTNDG